MNPSRNTVLVGLLLLISQFALGEQTTWIAAWTASPEAADSDPSDPIKCERSDRA